MKISSDKTRTYIPCKNCTEVQLTPDQHPRMSGPYSAKYTARNGATGFGASYSKFFTVLMRRDLRIWFRELMTLSYCPWTRQKNIISKTNFRK
ncbi:hypothetical protein TNCV_4672341 [Trichonephila clavipes]|nr:hypothetical protein TNCV_4672341 [Trichonephila clavipes]